HSVFFDAKFSAKLAMQSFGVIAQHVETAAFRGSLRAKCTHDDMSPRPHSIEHRLNVFPAQSDVDKKMKYRAVMPNIERSGRQGELSDISDDPVNPTRPMIQPRFRGFDSGLRNIEYRDGVVSAIKQIVDQGRLARANIDDRCGSITGVVCDES